MVAYARERRTLVLTIIRTFINSVYIQLQVRYIRFYHYYYIDTSLLLPESSIGAVLARFIRYNVYLILNFIVPKNITAVNFTVYLYREQISLSNFGYPVGFLAQIGFFLKIMRFSNLLTQSVTDDGYSRKASCVLCQIYTF